MQAYQRMTVKNIINFANPRTFVASIIPAIFGILLSLKLGYSLSLARALALIMACVFFQAAVNTINDYSDFVNGVDSLDDNLEEDDNVMFYSNIRPKSVENLAIIFLLIGIGLGFLGLDRMNFPSLVIAFIGLLTVFLYSKGTLPISYLPIGELVSGFVMGGLIPLGVFSAVSNSFDGKILLASLPFMLGIALIMMSNNASDIEKDRRAKRYTLAVVMGRQKVKVLYKISILLWLISQLSLTYYLAGLPILALNSVFLILRLRLIRNVFTASLLPEARIGQMISIVKANVLINGVYLTGILISLFGA